jgi:hypothetical protein
MTQKEDIIECLQAELVKVRLREAENDAVTRDLRARIHELEEVRSVNRTVLLRFLARLSANSILVII